MANNWRSLIRGDDPEDGERPPPVATVVPARPSAPDSRMIAPTTREELREWVREHLGIVLPLHAVCQGHNTPLDYLDYVFFERGAADPVVMACRGGGKTLLGAVATLLDMLFRPGIEIRILGGSDVQTERMYEHLVRFVEQKFRDKLIRGTKLGRITKTGFTFGNGSRVELLSQSEGSVRGARVQRIRCDEVDLFKDEVWEAVQLATRSRIREGRTIRGTVEALSTMNGDHGIMKKLVHEGKRKVFTWCAWDVAENCQADCRTCPLHGDCRGKARNAEGFVPISDLLTQFSRVKKRTWRYEILCNPSEGAAARPELQTRYY